MNNWGPVCWCQFSVFEGIAPSILLGAAMLDIVNNNNGVGRSVESVQEDKQFFHLSPSNINEHESME